MAGTVEGGLTAAATNKSKYGENFYATIGSTGGKKKNPNKGFGSNRELARIAGAKGGRKSKRSGGKYGY